MFLSIYVSMRFLTKHESFCNADLDSELLFSFYCMEEVLKQTCNFSVEGFPEVVSCDFEKGIWVAVHTVTPWAKVSNTGIFILLLTKPLHVVNS